MEITEPIEFEWDEGNKYKSGDKHFVTNEEAEESFLDPNRVIFFDFKHSIDEKRYLMIGKTKLDRLLYIVFTIRSYKIRVISARDINKKERTLYEKTAHSS